LAKPDIRPLSASDLSAANRRHDEKLVGVLGDEGGAWRYATKKVGTDHQPVFSRRTDRRGSGGTLRRIQAGIIGLTHSCASPFVKEGITVNAIAPALIETDMVTSNPNADPNLIPMGHFGSVDDVASVLLFSIFG
jgi:hypothetical protein